MPSIDLLLLPLLGGFWFLNTFYYTKFYHQRIERQRLIFNCLIIAFFLSILGLSIDYLILQKTLPQVRESLGHLLPHSTETFNSTILIFLLSYPLAFFLNWLFPQRYLLERIINKWGDDYEKLFWHSLSAKEDEAKLLMIRTNFNKTYVGYVNKISKPIGNSHITIIPYFSGYRDDSQKLIITTDYFSIMQEMIKEGEPHRISTLGFTLPRNTIISVSKFDLKVFSRFKKRIQTKTSS